MTKVSFVSPKMTRDLGTKKKNYMKCAADYIKLIKVYRSDVNMWWHLLLVSNFLIGCPEMSVTTILRCLTSQKRESLKSRKNQYVTKCYKMPRTWPDKSV